MTVAKSKIAKTSDDEVIKEVKTRKTRVVGAGRDRILNRIAVAQADLLKYDTKQSKPSASARRGLRAAFAFLSPMKIHYQALHVYGLAHADFNTIDALIDAMVEVHFSDAIVNAAPPSISTSTTAAETFQPSSPEWKPEWSTETDKVPA